MPIDKSHKSSKYCMHWEIWEWFQKPAVHWWWEDSGSCWTWLKHKGFLRTKATKQLAAVCTHSSCHFTLLCLYGYYPLQKEKRWFIWGFVPAQNIDSKGLPSVCVYRVKDFHYFFSCLCLALINSCHISHFHDFLLSFSPAFSTAVAVGFVYQYCGTVT